ncbi:hypothetical protein KIV45_25455 [Janthinobacterium lividum]|nr:hypothetical protein KIV45_25455 [Janthinobacterium lividum]
MNINLEYCMSKIRVGRIIGFHPRMLNDAVKMQAAEFEWLPAALENCSDGQWESTAYVRYVSRARPNEQGSLWQFESNILIEHEIFGTVVLDILKGYRLGGIEFLDQLDS